MPLVTAIVSIIAALCFLMRLTVLFCTSLTPCESLCDIQHTEADICLVLRIFIRLGEFVLQVPCRGILQLWLTKPKCPHLFLIQEKTELK